jgi:hypothetical protein
MPVAEPHLGAGPAMHVPPDVVQRHANTGVDHVATHPRDTTCTPPVSCV